jgi:2-oxoisovalerate dehydrogenase E1 component
VSQSSATGTQCVQAIGCADMGGCASGFLNRTASPVSSQTSRYACSLGDGSSSEGEFWESLNTACLGKLPVLFLVEDNGTRFQSCRRADSRRNLSRLVETFPNLKVVRCDGTDVLASYAAVSDAVAWCRARKDRDGPAKIGPTRTRRRRRAAA